MATAVSDDGDAARRLRAANIGLTRLLTRDMRGLRRLIIPSRLEQTIPDWMTAVRALVATYGQTSATLAADYYEAERIAARATGRFTVPLLDPPPDEQVDNSLRWATKDLWPRDPDAADTTEAQLQPLEARLVQAEKKAEAVAQKLVTDQGRGTIRDAARRDSQATAWARSAALGACAFCKLMATRGAVYKDARAAGRDANDRFSGDASVVKFHDNCHCGIVPIFKGQAFEPAAHTREWERLYREFAAPHSGDQLRRFRRALADHGHLPTP